MSTEIIDALVGTAANLATLLLAMPPQQAALQLLAVHAHLLELFADEYGDHIGQLIADAFTNAVVGRKAELEAGNVKRILQ
jgi:hypothetical protein